jgi:ankyrin repeat protein
MIRRPMIGGFRVWVFCVVGIFVGGQCLAEGRAAKGNSPVVADQIERWVSQVVERQPSEERLQTIEELLASGNEVDAPQPDGTTALHWAVELDDTALVKVLLENRAKASVKNRYGVRPLFLACQNGNAAIVAILLNAGADPEARLPTGETPLMTAARTGRLNQSSCC